MVHYFTRHISRDNNVNQEGKKIHHHSAKTTKERARKTTTTITTETYRMTNWWQWVLPLLQGRGKMGNISTCDLPVGIRMLTCWQWSHPTHAISTSAILNQIWRANVLRVLWLMNISVDASYVVWGFTAVTLSWPV
jgi:hypothetical protein